MRERHVYANRGYNKPRWKRASLVGAAGTCYITWIGPIVIISVPEGTVARIARYTESELEPA